MTCIVPPALCPSVPSLFAYENKCIEECPAGTYKHPDDRTCEGSCTGDYYADDSTRRCVDVCPTNPNLFGHNNECIPECPPDWFSDNSTRTCTQLCNRTVGYLAYVPLKICVLVCPNNTYQHGDECIDTCPNDTAPFYYKDPTTLKCVTDCPDYYFKDDLTG